MGVAVDQAGDDGLAGDVDGAGVGRNRDLAAPAERGDTVALDKDYAVVDDPAGTVIDSETPLAGGV